MPNAATSTAPIEFIDLGAQRRRIGARMDEAIGRVVDHGRYILGPEVTEFERQLAEFCGAKHVLTCANGTDALGLALMALGLKRRPGGDRSRPSPLPRPRKSSLGSARPRSSSM